ncbi:MAG: sugar ABC transporter substrate-binding protein, partial [Candidatus Bathyarchaeia archaeon]
MEENPTIKVNYTTVAGEVYRAKLVTMFAAGEVPYDIIWCPTSWLYEFADNGWIIPVEKYIPSKIWDDLAPITKQTLEYNGHRWGLPWYLALGFAFMYNREMVKKAGIAEPPKTWDEVIEQCLTVKDKGVCRYPMSFSAMQDMDTWATFKALLKAMGGKFYDDEGNCLYNSDLGVKALQWMVDCIYKYDILHPTCLETEMHGAIELLAAGETCFQLKVYYYMKIANDPTTSKVPGQIETCLMPGPSDKPAQGGSLGSSPAWGITKYCKNPDAAYRFLEFLGGPIGNKMWAVERSLFPAYTSVAKDPDVVNAIKGADVWGEQAKYGVFELTKNYNLPEMKYSAELTDFAMVEVSMALTGVKTAKEALDAVVEKVKELKTKV